MGTTLCVVHVHFKLQGVPYHKDHHCSTCYSEHHSRRDNDIYIIKDKMALTVAPEKYFIT